METFPLEEYQKRIEKIAAEIKKENKDGFLAFNPYNAFYLGLYYYPGKRPVVLYIHYSGEVFAFTPKMEYEEAKECKQFDKVFAYEDGFTKQADLFSFIKEKLGENFSKVEKIAVDEVNMEGYRRLKEEFQEVTLQDTIMKIRKIKSKREVEVLKKSAFYSDYIVEKGKEMLKPGVTELGLLNRMITKTVDKMIEDMGDVLYVPGGPAGALVPSGVRTAMPHALPSGKVVQKGDTMILSCGANVWGYRTECERTFFLGQPSKEKIEAFEVMHKAQALGIKLMKPGAVCEDIEKEVIAYIEDAGYGGYLKHRTGHGKGLEEHEEPYIAAGDQTVLQEGMVFSSEPGIYIDGFSGFRHSDIVVITEKGCEVLTQYPKDLESMIIDLGEE